MALNRKALNKAFHEVHSNPPDILAHTERKFGSDRANRQRIAIALSKAKQAGRRKHAMGGAVRPAVGMRGSPRPAGGGFRRYAEGGAVTRSARPTGPMADFGRAIPQMLANAPPAVKAGYERAGALAQNLLSDQAAHGQAPIQPPNAGVMRMGAAANQPGVVRPGSSGFRGLPLMGKLAAMGQRSPNMAQIQQLMAQLGQRQRQRGFAEGGPTLGGQGLLARRKEYQRYVEDIQEQGEAPISFADWLAQEQAQESAMMGAESPDLPAQAPMREPIIDVIMNKLRSFKFAGGGSVDPDLLDPDYYESDMIPQGTARMAAEMAANRGAWPMATTADARARLARLRAIIAALTARAGDSMTGGEAPIGSRAELLERTRPMRALGGAIRRPVTGFRGSVPGAMGRRYAEGGGIHHVNPRGHGGFSHMLSDGTFTFADGGPMPEGFSIGGQPVDPGAIPPELAAMMGGAAPGAAPGPAGGPPLGPTAGPAPAPGAPSAGAAPGAGGMPPAGGGLAPTPSMSSANNVVNQAAGALATLGQQLLKERAALQSSFNIPPPAGPPAGGAPPAGPPMPTAPSTMMQSALQERLQPQLAGGGGVSANIMRMAARNPRAGVNLCKCMGGKV